MHEPEDKPGRQRNPQPQDDQRDQPGSERERMPGRQPGSDTEEDELE